MRTVARNIRYSAVLAGPGLFGLWLLAVPGTVPVSIYLLGAAILTSMTAVMLMTFTNAQTSSSIAQVLHETEMTAAPVRTGRRGASIDS